MDLEETFDAACADIGITAMNKGGCFEMAEAAAKRNGVILDSVKVVDRRDENRGLVQAHFYGDRSADGIQMVIPIVIKLT